MRVAFGVEYDGSEFHGWQIQSAENRTVQACVEEALSAVADNQVTTRCAGRTDAGVHAVGQIIHIETQAVRNERSWVLGTNRHLPPDISILWAKLMPDEFHARFSAIRRSYKYFILNRASRGGLFGRYVTWECRELNAKIMQEAANCLIGLHDFSSFRAQGCQAKSPIREIYRLDIKRQDDLIVIEIEANAFLHHMVRNIAGVLMTIGRGEAEPTWTAEILQKRDRKQGGVTAPAQGLFFWNVTYPDIYQLESLCTTKNSFERLLQF